MRGKSSAAGLDAPPEETRGATWAKYLLALIVPVTLLAIGAFMWAAKSRDRADAQTCLSRGDVRQVVEGVIRQAGTGFFVVADRWQLITGTCTGRHRSSCLKAHPGVEALEKEVGGAVLVEYCGEHAVAYQVAGRRYEITTLPEEPLKVTP